MAEQWEYRVITWASASGIVPGLSVENALDQLGSEGWELVSVVLGVTIRSAEQVLTQQGYAAPVDTWNAHRYEAFFKRRKQ